MANRSNSWKLAVALLFVVGAMHAMSSDWSDVVEWVYDTSAHSQYYAPPCSDSPILPDTIDLRLRTINANAEIILVGSIVSFR